MSNRFQGFCSVNASVKYKEDKKVFPKPPKVIPMVGRPLGSDADAPFRKELE